MLVYVDDMLIIGDGLKLIEDAKVILQQSFKMKNLGELRFFLGIEFARSSKGILMHQRKYTLKAAKPIVTLMDYNVKLTSKQFDDHIKQLQPIDDPPADQGAYKKLDHD